MRTQFTIKSKFLHLILVVIFLLYSKNSLAQLTQFHQSFDDLNTPSLPEGWLSKIQVSISNTIAEVKTVHHANATSQPNAVFIMNGLDGTNGQPDANAFVSLASPLIEVGEFGAKVTFTASGGQPIVLGKLTNISDLETFTELQTYILNSEFQEFSYEFASQENIYLVFKNSNQISVNPIFVDEVIFEQLEGPQAPLTEFHENFDEISLPLLPEGWRSKINVLLSNTIAEVKTVHHANTTSQPNAVFVMNGLDGSNGQPDTHAFVSVASPLIQVLENGAKVTFTASGGNPITLGILTDFEDVATFTALETFDLNSNFQEFSYEIMEPQIGYLVFKNGNTTAVDPIFIDDVVFKQLDTPEAPLTEFHESFDKITLPELPENWKRKVNVLLSNTIAEVKTVHHANTTSQPNAVFVMNGLDGSNGQTDTNAFVSVISPLIQVLENGAKVTFTASGGNPITLGILTDFEDVETFTALETFDLNSNFQEFSYEIMEPQIGYLVFKNGNTTAVNPIFIDDVIFKQLKEIMSIDDFDRNSVLIYPNPSKDKISVSSDSFITKIELFDLSGKKIIEKKNNSNETSLNISQLTKGTYFIQITQGNIKQSKTIIKK